MSLKAKLEAVVYAAEEPVTLSLLAAIFAEEVLQGLDEEPSPEVEPGPEQIALPEMDPAVSPELSSDAQSAAAVAEPVTEEGSAGETAPAEGAEPVTAETAAETSEGDEKKSARLRDRRVRQVLQRVLDELIADYANSERGMEIREIAGGYRMATKPEYHDAVRGFVKSLKPPMKLSLQALETLAVIAYKQPVTAPEVSEIRGVDSGGVLGGLVSRKLITTAGRKPVIGRPILYKTTKEFLLRFGLKDVNDLPSMEEFEKMAGELAESEAEGEAQDAVMQSTEPLVSAGETTPGAEEVAEGEAETSAEEPVAEAEAGPHGSEEVAQGEAEPSAEEPVVEAEAGPHGSEETAQGESEPPVVEAEAEPHGSAEAVLAPQGGTEEL